MHILLGSQCCFSDDSEDVRIEESADLAPAVALPEASSGGVGVGTFARRAEGQGRGPVNTSSAGPLLQAVRLQRRRGEFLDNGAACLGGSPVSEALCLECQGERAPLGWHFAKVGPGLSWRIVDQSGTPQRTKEQG